MNPLSTLLGSIKSFVASLRDHARARAARRALAKDDAKAKKENVK